MGKLIELTFADTGYTVQIRKVSPNTINDFRRAWLRSHPEPRPPLNTVDYGDGSGERAPRIAREGSCCAPQATAPEASPCCG